MPFQVDVTNEFNPQAVGATIKALPPLKTPVMDTLFPEAARGQHPFSMIGVDVIKEITQTAPVVGRDAPGTPVGGDERQIDFIQPLGFRPTDTVTAAEINDLRLLDAGGLEAWRSSKIDALRRIIRRSTEGLCAQATDGAIAYPMKLRNGGWGSYTVSFGAIQSHVPAVKWNTAGAKLKDILACLLEMQKQLQAKGHGSAPIVWASPEAYFSLLDLVTNVTTTTKISVEVADDNRIRVGGFMVALQNGTWKNPQTGADVPILAAKKIKMIDPSMFRFKYLALDNFKAGLMPLPFFVEANEERNPSRVELIGESKPLPIPVPSAICEAEAAE